MKNHDGDITPGMNSYYGYDALPVSPPPIKNRRPWCASGQRWDEDCDRCGQTTVVDNNTGLCKKCY